MRVVVKEPNKTGTIEQVTNELETFNNLVGGYIECLNIKDNLILVCNEEGKLMDLEPNLYFNNDTVVGTVVFVEFNRDGDFVGLSDNSIEYLKSMTII